MGGISCPVYCFYFHLLRWMFSVLSFRRQCVRGDGGRGKDCLLNLSVIHSSDFFNDYMKALML